VQHDHLRDVGATFHSISDRASIGPAQTSRAHSLQDAAHSHKSKQQTMGEQRWGKPLVRLVYRLVANPSEESFPTMALSSPPLAKRLSCVTSKILPLIAT
jgi:hypothetical protein